jgi:ABC-2 type transport system permease protein
MVSVTALLLTSLVAALGGFITALFAKSFDQLTLIQGSILTPLTYMGGVFTSISTLPHCAQKLSFLDPAFYMVNAFRYGFLGISDVPVGMALAVMSVLAIVLFFAAASLMTGKPGIRD